MVFMRPIYIEYRVCGLGHVHFGMMMVFDVGYIVSRVCGWTNDGVYVDYKVNRVSIIV